MQCNVFRLEVDSTFGNAGFSNFLLCLQYGEYYPVRCFCYKERANSALYENLLRGNAIYVFADYVESAESVAKSEYVPHGYDLLPCRGMWVIACVLLIGFKKL